MSPAHIISDIYNLLFPETCPGCSSCLSPNESILCTTCRHQLPVTNYHLICGNPVEKIFYGRVKVESAAAFLPFRKKGIARQLIHHLKYKGREEIGEFLGKWYGSCLRESNLAGKVDMVVPVPLHSKKRRKRGYNQVSAFARCIASALQVVYREDILVKTVNTTTQTYKGKLARWKESDSTFNTTQNIHLPPCHILLVDDVVTTGSTLEHCVRALQKYGNVKVSIVTMAVTV